MSKSQWQSNTYTESGTQTLHGPKPQVTQWRQMLCPMRVIIPLIGRGNFSTVWISHISKCFFIRQHVIPQHISLHYKLPVTGTQPHKQRQSHFINHIKFDYQGSSYSGGSSSKDILVTHRVEPPPLIFYNQMQDHSYVIWLLPTPIFVLCNFLKTATKSCIYGPNCLMENL